MKDTLFTVWFATGDTFDTYAPGPLEAMILAQSKAIMNGQNYKVDCVRDEETGERYKFLAAQACRME